VHVQRGVAQVQVALLRPLHALLQGPGLLGHGAQRQGCGYQKMNCSHASGQGIAAPGNKSSRASASAPRSWMSGAKAMRMARSLSGAWAMKDRGGTSLCRERTDQQA